VVLGLMAVAVGACEWAQWPFLRQPLARVLSDRLQRDVAIDAPFGIRFIGGLRLRSDHLLIGPAQPGEQALLDARQIALSLRWSDLLAWRSSGGALQVRELSVARIDAHLLRDAAGQANWQFGDPAAPRDPNAPPPQMPSFEHLTVQDGRLTVRDAPMQVDLTAEFSTAEGNAPASAASAAAQGASAASSSSPAGAIPPGLAGKVPAGLRVQARGRWRGGDVSAVLQASGVLPLADTRPQAASVPVSLRLDLGGARLSLDGQARDMVHLGGLDGRFEVGGPSLAAAGAPLGVTLPRTGPFKASGRVTKNGMRWGVKLAQLAVGDTRLGGDFVFDAGRDVPRLSGTLTGSRLSLPDLAPAFGAQPRTGMPDTDTSGGGTNNTPRTKPPPRAPDARMLPQRDFDLPSLRAMDADILLAVDRADIGTVWLEPLQPLAGRLQLVGGLLTVKNLLARSAGGEVRGGLSIDGRPQVPRWGAELRWSGVRLERFVKARDAVDRRAGGKGPYIAGNLNGHVDLKGVGRSTAAMLASLDGSGRLWVRDGSISHLVIELSGIDIAESLGLLVRGDSPLPMRCAVAQFSVKNGEVQPDVGLIDTDDTTITVSGSLSLADERLGLLLTARPQDFSPLALRTPVHVEGTFAAPSVRLDKRSLGLRLAGAAALAAITPVASLLALFDLGESDKAACENAAAKLQAMQPPSRRAAPARDPSASR
jgi:uncharacterized protein involved in outer membrane biogenesis